MGTKGKTKKKVEAIGPVVSREDELQQQGGFTEEGDFVCEPEETETPEPEKSLQEVEDETFMDEITENKKPLSDFERRRRILSLTGQIEDAKTRMSEIEPIVELGKSEGFRKLVEEVKGGVHSMVDEENIKDSTKGLKALDSVLTTERLVQGYNFQFNSKKTDIKQWEGDIIELKAGQQNLFDNTSTKKAVENYAKAPANHISVDTSALG